MAAGTNGRGVQGALVRQGVSWGGFAWWVGLIMAGLVALWLARPADGAGHADRTMSAELGASPQMRGSGGAATSAVEEEPAGTGQNEQAKPTFGRHRAACAERGLLGAGTWLAPQRPHTHAAGPLPARGPPGGDPVL